MKFVDTNVFLHAFLRPKRKLEKHEIEIKQKARLIIEKIDNNENITTSVVNVSEIANIIEANYNHENSVDIINSIIQHPNIEICGVEKGDYAGAIFLAKETQKRVNDMLMVMLMKKLKISCIYSFDSDFDNIEGITRLTH